MSQDVIDHQMLPAIAPGDRRYEQVRHTYASAGAPALVIAAETPEDVSGTVRLAAERRLPLAVRSGGHGPSTNDGGIVLDLGRLRAVDVLDGTGLVRVEAGARWGEVAQRLDRHDLALTSGDTGDVGVGGVATVGGVGVFARRQGLTIDRVKAVEVVLADGTLVRADEHERADLLWAVRGAGGGVGVVVAFEFQADRIEHVTAAEIVYDASDLPGLFMRWAELVEASPRDVSSFLYVQPDSRARALVVDAGAGRVERFAEVAPVLAQRASVVRYHTLLETSRSPHHAQAAGLAARGGLLDHVTADSAAAMADLLTSGAALVLQLRSVGGAVNDVAPDATAYAHRTQHFSVVLAAPRPQAHRLDAIGEYTSGAYLNLESERDAGVMRRAFPPSTLARLHEVKRRYDPTDLFRHNLSLPAGVNP